MPEQRRNRYWFDVSFPDEWPDEPTLTGTTQRFYYPTLDAARIAMLGFQQRGAVC